MPEQNLTKTLAHFVFLFLFVYAACFYVERLTCDTSFFAFKIICFEKFNIEAGRYANFITQIIPLILIKLHASLKTILISYSLSFVVIFYISFLINLYVFSSLRAGLAATFLLFLGISDTSFYAVTEIFLGMMASVLFYGLLEYYFINEIHFSKLKKYFLILTGCLIILICRYSHPATLFPVLFILIFETIDKKLIKNKVVYIFTLFAVLVFTLKYISIDSNSYEGEQIEPLFNLVSVSRNFSHLYSVQFFIKFVNKGVYILPLSLFIINLLYYFFRRNFIKLTYTLLATTGFFLLLMIIYSKGDSDLGMEKNMIPLWIFIALPFIHDVLFREFRYIYMRAIIYFVVAVTGLSGFYRAAVFYGDRVKYMEQIIETVSGATKAHKIIMERKNLNMDRLAGTWSFANETLLISSLKGPQYSRTIYLVDNPEQLKDYDMKKKDVYLCVPFWLEWNYSTLNQLYFQLPEEPYFLFDLTPCLQILNPNGVIHRLSPSSILTAL